MPAFNSPRTAHGRGGPVQPPLWVRGLAVDEVRAVAGTSPAAVGLDGYCGWAHNKAQNRLIYGAAGGHDFDGADNSVNELDLTLDAPTWVQLKATTPLGQVTPNQPHNSDGTPNARHIYAYSRWVPGRRGGEYVLLGCYAPYGGASGYNNCDGYSPSEGTWAPANSMDPCQGGHYGNCELPNGDMWALWASNSSRYWTAATGLWSNPGVSGTDTFVRFPWAYDTTRNQAFGLAFGDSQGSNASELRAVKLVGSVKSAITLTGPGLAQFIADAAATSAMYPGMDYCPVSDAFYWYCGLGANAGHMFRVRPNGTSTWTIEQVAITGAAIPASGTGGISSKVSCVQFPDVAGVVFMPSRAAGCYFLRTA